MIEIYLIIKNILEMYSVVVYQQSQKAVPLLCDPYLRRPDVTFPLFFEGFIIGVFCK